jgi:hypothetical protein
MQISKIFNKKLFKKAVISLFFIFLAALFLFSVNNVVFAQDQADNLLWGGQQNQIQQASGLGNSDPRIIIARIIQVLLGFLGIIAVIIIMYAGFLWMTANGEEAKVDKAKKTLTSAAIGLVIILMSFAIASYVLNMLYGAINGQSGNPTSAPSSSMGGFSALGNCTLESVYPEPDQREVARNTSIIVTFREPIITTSVIVGDSIQIYPQASSTNSLTPGDVSVNFTADHKTMVLIPLNYLGSPSEYIWYTVKLTNGIAKTGANGLDVGIFSTCSYGGYQWNFQVSNKIDLDPPHVLTSGVFPAPDNARDTYSSTSAVQATGQITVSNQPNYYIPANQTNVNPNTATVTMDPQCQENGQLNITILDAGSGSLAATLVRNAGPVSLGSVPVGAGDTSITFPNYLTLTLGSTFAAGNSWQVMATPERPADTLTIGDITYSFINGASSGNQIQSNPSQAVTAVNIRDVINVTSSEVQASVLGTIVRLEAIVGGTAGNNIQLITNAAGRIAVLPVGHLDGGVNSGQTVTVNDRKDKPRNAVIQINFNEAVIPITLSGTAADVANTIRVVNIDTAANLNGKFTISNQYRTIEFLSDNLCGVNGCGQEIYCLPENSHLRVEIVASDLSGCASNAQCASRSPYNNCVGGHCQDSTLRNFPLSAFPPFVGVMDVAMNSLDGNRNNNAQGPSTFYNENTPNPADGDSYQWSFFINNMIEMGAPVIRSATPANSAGNVSSDADINMEFNKLMMSSSLKSGSILVKSGNNTNVEHKLINLKSLSINPVGYYIKSQNIDENTYGTPSTPPDGEADITTVTIGHSRLGDSTSYRGQVGSGVNDIYQNCYKPSGGPACTGANAVTDALPTCCSNGTAQVNATCP